MRSFATMEQSELDAARRELAELYKELELAWPASRGRMEIELQIARVRERITQLESAE